MHKNKTLLFLLALVIILGSFFMWRKNQTGLDLSGTPEEAYLLEMEKRVELLSQDIYGGTTPEETLALFISALEVGDTELAAKYFVIDKQEEMANGFNLSIRNGFMDKLISLLKKEGRGTLVFDENYSYSIVEDGIEIFGVEFVLNEYANIWKIESL